MAERDAKSACCAIYTRKSTEEEIEQNFDSLDCPNCRGGSELKGRNVWRSNRCESYRRETVPHA